MYLTIKNKVITTPVEQIIKQLKSELTNGLLHDIEPRAGQNIKVTCPKHKEGRERRPSCYVFADETDKQIQTFSAKSSERTSSFTS